MSDYLTPTTELQAVNTIVGAISESPVEEIVEGEMGADVEIALHILRTASRALQLKGWYWNTEEEYELTPNVDDEIDIPSNTLKVDPSGDDVLKQYVQRGTRLYDRENSTYTIEDPVKVHLTVMLAFDELPEAARHYIAVRASRQFIDRVMGDDALHAYSKQDEIDAWMELQNAESAYADHNLADDPTIARTIGRHLRRPR